MSKIKINDLEKIIAEEIKNTLLEEGIFSQFGAGLKGAAGQVGGAIKGAAKQIRQGYQQAKFDKMVEEELAEKIAAFINAAESYPEAKEFVKGTELGKQLYGLNEQYGEQQILQMMQNKGLIKSSILTSFLNKAFAASSNSKEVSDLLRMSDLSRYQTSSPSDKTQTDVTKPGVPSSKASQNDLKSVEKTSDTPKPQPLPSAVRSSDPTQVDKTEVDPTQVDQTEVDKTQVDKTEVDKTVTDFGSTEDEAQIISARNAIEDGDLSRAVEMLKVSSQSVQPSIANMIVNKLKQTYKF